MCYWVGFDTSSLKGFSTNCSSSCLSSSMGFDYYLLLIFSCKAKDCAECCCLSDRMGFSKTWTGCVEGFSLSHHRNCLSDFKMADEREYHINSSRL